MARWLEELDAVPKVVTGGILKRCMPKIKDEDEWAEAINKAWTVIEPKDPAMFLAQIGHESMDLSALKENLRYSAQRLMQVWPSRFPTLDAARPYENNPQALANNVYANRLGNKYPNDGWRFAGKGPIQLTGRYNYEMFFDDTDIDVVEKPNLLIRDKMIGMLSACWFFDGYVRGDTVEEVTRSIQGAQLGLRDRRLRYNQCIAALRGR